MKLALLSLALLAASCNKEEGLPQSDLSVPPDLTVLHDMAMRVPDGVVCGNQTCSGGNTCCIRRNASNQLTQMCMPMGTCGDGGAEAACDGPEDCSTAQPNCCVSVSFRQGPDGGAPDPTGGAATCTASCPASFDLAAGTATSKLCNTIDDCVGYDSGGIDFDGCCCNNMLKGVKFCAPLAFAGNFYSCTNCP